MTATGRTNIERAFGCYTGGIDVALRPGLDRARQHASRASTARTARSPSTPSTSGRGSRDTLVENNYIGTPRGIGFGLVETARRARIPTTRIPGLSSATTAASSATT